MKYNACVNLSNFSATLLKLSSRDGVISWMFFMNICHSITKCRVSLDNQCVSKVIDTCFIYHASITICNLSRPDFG